MDSLHVANEQLKYTADRYVWLLNSMDQGFCIIEVIWEDNQAIDYRFLEVNNAFERQTGITDAVGKTMKEIEPMHEPHWFQIFGDVVTTGSPVRLEAPAQYLINGWYEIHAFRISEETNQVAVLFHDISERKLNEKLAFEFRTQLEHQVGERTLALKENQLLLEATLDSSKNFTEVLQAIRDNKRGNIIDFRWMYINKLAETRLGKVVGKRFLATHKDEINFERYAWVTETGNSVMFEQMLSYGAVHRWYDINLVKLHDGVVVKGLDITERKEAELNLKRSNQLLQSIFDTSLIGLLVVEAIRDEEDEIVDFRIKMVNKEFERETDLTDLVGKRYLKVFPDAIRNGIWNAMIQVTDFGRSQQMEYQRSVQEEEVWYIYMFIKMDDGLVITTQDITQRKLAERKLKEDDERLKELEKQQQQALFMASLQAQEKERTRIAENLHNGLGQLLYSVKLNLDQLKTKQCMHQREDKQSLLNAERLLSDAIRETRRISHELMPTILEDFGLQAAVKDMCDQFNKSIHFDCAFIGDEYELDKYTKIAIYRIIQELVMNIIKHANASKASVSIELNDEYVDLIISDNGSGFNKQTNKKGIGLSTIQNKIQLLNGSFTIHSDPGTGSNIHIHFPNRHNSN